MPCIEVDEVVRWRRQNKQMEMAAAVAWCDLKAQGSCTQNHQGMASTTDQAWVNNSWYYTLLSSNIMNMLIFYQAMSWEGVHVIYFIYFTFINSWYESPLCYFVNIIHKHNTNTRSSVYTRKHMEKKCYMHFF